MTKFQVGRHVEVHIMHGRTWAKATIVSPEITEAGRSGDYEIRFTDGSVGVFNAKKIRPVSP
jgi:hypothetical protein